MMQNKNANRVLAEQAHAFAEQHPSGSLDHKAWACVAVCLRTSSTVAGARRSLTEIPVAEVRARAAELLASLDQERAA